MPKGVRKTRARKSTKKDVETYAHTKDVRKKLPTEQTEPFMSDEDKKRLSYKPEIRKVGSMPTLNWQKLGGGETTTMG